MPKNLGHIESLARPYTDAAIKTLAGIMMNPSASAMPLVTGERLGHFT
jgi:hypothetical protein